MTARARRLYAVCDSPPLDELLAALDKWRDATRDATSASQPAAFLEIGDEEITSDSWLTAAQVKRLTQLLACDAHAARPEHGAFG